MMDKNEMLTLSYSTLHNMLDDAQHDGLFADGCCYDLDYDIDEEIKRNIESGDIKIVEDYNNGSYISREEAKADSDKYQWFPVGESVPDTSRAVLVTFKNGTVGKAWYNGTLWASNTSRCLTTVIAWCELPKPYSESEDK